MAKRKVFCPDCGNQFTAQFNGIHGQTAGVRFHRTTTNQYETSINAPGEMTEYDRFYTMTDQLLAAGAVGIIAGTTFGYFASLPWHAIDTLITSQIIVGSALSGWTMGWSLLAKERAWQLGKVLPDAVDQYLALAKSKIPAGAEGVSLTVDHRYRDGHTEVGRTINRFGELPVDLERFNEWVQGALVGKSLAVSNWTPQAKGFSRPEYDALINKMKAAEIVINLGSSKGNTLTGGGRRALTQHLKDYGITPPSPASEDDFLGKRWAVAKASNGGNTPLPHSEVRAGGQNEG